jgi:hypothetical protein
MSTSSVYKNTNRLLEDLVYIDYIDIVYKKVNS